MKKYLLHMVALLTAILILSCTAKTREENKETLIVAALAAPATLDPVKTSDTASAVLMKQIYDTLVTLDFTTMEPVPSVAERYQFENDDRGQPRLLRLFLKRGVLFHNGDELKASDVKFTFDRAVESPFAISVAAQIEATEVINDYEVLVTLRAPFAPILRNLAHPALSLVSERAISELEDDLVRHPIGSGPLKFVSYATGERVELTRWDSYWGGAPRIKDVIIRYIPDTMTQVLELETGGVDMLTNVSPHDISRIEGNPGLQIFRRTSLQLNYIGFNMQKAPFSDIRVRRAIAHAIDMDALVGNVWPGVGAPGRGVVNSVVWASAAGELPRLEFDPARARQLLAEAGLSNGFSVTIATNQDPERIASIEVARNMLAQVGITVDISIMEWAAYLDWTNRGEHDMFVLGWTPVTGDPDIGTLIFHSSSLGAGGNRFFLNSPEVDRLLDLARMETNPEARRSLYLDAQKLIHGQVPLLPTLEGEVLVAARANLRGFNPAPTFIHPFWTVYFED